MHVETRELLKEELGTAEDLWRHYRDQKADRENDRIFAVYLGDKPVSVAWCKRHPDELEVDGVFIHESLMRHEYARCAVVALIAACGSEALFMHAIHELMEFHHRCDLS